VNSPDDANLVISAASTTPIGGVSEGVLGYYSETEGQGEVILVQGWDWYQGEDPAGIGQGQFDFQTIVLHEIGHAIGLGHNTAASSVMHSELSSGVVKRTVTEEDLNIPEGDGGGGEGLFAVGYHKDSSAIPEPAPAPTANRVSMGPASMSARFEQSDPARFPTEAVTVASPLTNGGGILGSAHLPPNAGIGGLDGFTSNLTWSGGGRHLLVGGSNDDDRNENPGGKIPQVGGFRSDTHLGIANDDNFLGGIPVEGNTPVSTGQNPVPRSGHDYGTARVAAGPVAYRPVADHLEFEH
jgi:hypothetical protein